MTRKRLSRLDNGMRLITEAVDHVETVALGIWLDKGSRHESAEQNGMFHFIEHTLFKGTPTRNARQIAETMDSIGGVLDAYTAKEETCYSIKVRRKHLDHTLEIMADMLQNPLFDPDELNRERGVILEEIKMEEDNAEDLVYEKSMQNCWPDHPLGRPILGPPENVARFDHDEVSAFHRYFYRPQNMIVAAAGLLDHDHLAKRLNELFPAQPILDYKPLQPAPNCAPHQVYIQRSSLEQMNFCLNFQGICQTDKRYEQLALLNTLLGAGMSCRLFQKIREDRGLTYSIGSFTFSAADTGLVTLYGACSPKHFDQVIDLCLEELRLLCQNGLEKGELDRAREQYTGSLVMGLEGTASRSGALARTLMYLDEVFDVGKVQADLERVTEDDVLALARDLFTDQAMSLCAIGKFDQEAPATPWKLFKSAPAQMM